MKLFHKAEDAKDDARRADGDDGKRNDISAAATTRTGEDRDNDLSAPSPEAGPDSPAELKGKGLFAALKRTFKQFSEDNVSDWAAALTYYGVLSIFPGLLVLVSILGMLSNNGQQTVQNTLK
jgi:membrane protein